MKKLKDTAVGQFLKSKGFNAVMDTVGTMVPGVSILNQVKEMVIGDPTFKALPEEDQQQFLKLHQVEMDELDLILKDVQNARSREVAVNDSEHSSWLSKNIAPLLAAVLVVFSLTLFLLVLLREVKAPENITFLVVGGVSSIVTSIVQYYFGSSRSAATKDETIRKILNSEQ